MKNFNFSSGEISFSSLPTKLEREIFRLIIGGQNTFTTDKLIEKFGVPLEKLLLLIEKFQKKIIIYREEDRIISGNIITGYEKNGDTLTLHLSENFKRSLSGDTFSDFKILFNLTEETAMRFYLEVCKKTSSIFETTLSLEEIKDLLHVDKYDRFYDFERFVLKKLKVDIEENTPYILSYEKVKSGGFQNSKISHVKIIVTKKSYYENSASAIELLGGTKLYTNSNLALLAIIELLEKYSKEELLRGIALLSDKETIEVNLREKANIIKKQSEDFKLIYHTRETFSNILKLQNKIFKEIKKFETSEFLYDEFVTSNILKKLYRLISEKELNFENAKVKLQIKSFGNKEYEVKIFSK